MSDTLTVSNINYKNISGSTITTSTITGSVLNISTLSFQSTVISLGQSTSQAYNNFTNGSFTAGWASTLSTTASTAGAGLSRVQRVTMSQSGQYQLAVQSSVASYSVVKSSDSGVTWQTLTNGANGLPAGSPAYTSISYSATGQYALAAVNSGGLYVSNNASAATPTFTVAGTGMPYIYLPMEGTLTDVMGNSATTTPGTVPGYTTGIVGTQAVNLANTPGASGSGIRCVRCPWTGSANFTMSFWFNAQQPNSASYQYIVSAYGSLFVVAITPSGQLYFVIPSGGGTNYQLAAYGPFLSANVWYQVTAIFKTGAACSLYVNNVLYGTYTNVSGVGTATTANVGLGVDDNSLVVPFNGYIDDFRLYNSAVVPSPLLPANWSHTAVSATGQYMLAASSPSGSGGCLFQSADFGKTWTQASALLKGSVWTSLSQSESGQYALATTSAASIQPNLTGLAAATWSTNGVSWVASQSSAYLGTFVAYKIFNNTITSGDSWASTTTYNTSGNSSGFYTVIQGVGSVQGDWAQIQSSIPLIMSSYQFATSYNTSRLPKTYYIVGSNDGTIWYPIQYVSGGTVTSTLTYTLVPSVIIVNIAGTQSFGTSSIVTTTYSTTTNAYTYFRLVALTTYISSGGELLDIGEWYINFVGGLTCTSNYGQTWSNAANPLFTDSSAVSGDGQYTLGVSNQLLPYAYLPLNGSQNDSSGVLTNATNGTGSGAVTFPGTIYKVGTNAAYITNTAGATTSLSYLNYTVPTALVQPNTLTMACWVYPTAIPATGWSVPIGFNGIGSTAFGTQIAIQTTGIPLAQIYGTSTVGYAYGNAAINTNTWTHLAMTFSTGTGSFYVNGVLQSTVGGIGVLSVYGSGSVTNFYVGANTTAWGGFAGYIDDVRIYTSALTPTAIAELYAVPALNPIPLLNLGSNYLMGIGGSSYTPITLPNINANICGAACSNTGQYMVVVTQGTTNNVYYSTNYGSTWTALTVGSSAMTSCVMSVDGTYITVSNATNVYTLNWNGQGFTVALGSAAGAVNQANNAIAIGNQAGQTNQTANSIVLNASGAAVNPYTQGFYVAPIQPAISSLAPTFPLLGYGSDNQIVQSATSFSNSQQTVYGEWIQYQLATPSPITSYTLYGASGYPQFNMISWVIVGSNDGTNWTLLDTQTGTAGWGTYTLTQATAPYTYYRMVITQLSSTNLLNGTYYVDVAGWILSNGAPIFGPAANYTLATGSQGYSTVLQLNGTTVCTTTFSFTSTTKLGITLNGTTPNGLIPTIDGYKNGSVFIGFIYTIGTTSEYNSSFIAFQGTSTTINTTVLGNTNMSGVLCLMGGSRVGIGSTMPQYALDVAGTAQLNGTIPAYGQPDSAAVVPNSTFGQTWSVVTGLSTSALWNGCAVSATGQYMTVCVYGAASGNNIYYSSNYGTTWTLATGFAANVNYTIISMSSSGQYQLTGINTSGLTGVASVYTSSNYGATWTGTAYSTGNWFRNCMSSTGQYQYILQYISGGGGIWSSSNYGVTFTQTSAIAAPAGTVWNSICCSASGQYVSAGLNSGTIYYSSNYGASWSSSGVASAYWIGMCCSASGQYQTAVVLGGGIWYSNNYGVSWTASNAPTTTWVTPSCSTSGQYQIAVVNSGYNYYSTNYGISWTQSGSASATWQYCGMSQNGMYTIACVGGGAVYLSTLTNIGLVTNGRVGIGAAVPESLLTLYGSNIGAIAPTLTGQWKAQHAIYATSAYCLKLGAHYTAGVGAYSSIQSTEYYSGTEHPGSLILQPIGGYVGIGITNPSYTLHVNGPIYSGNSGILYLNAGGTINGDNIFLGRIFFVDAGGYASPAASIEAYGMGGSGTYGAELRFNTNAYSYGGTLKRMTIGKTGTISFNAYGAGTLNTDSSGNIFTSSDIRTKNNIAYLPSTGEISKLMQIRPATFNRNDDTFKSYIGFIANDLMEVYPNCVDGKKYSYQFESDSDGQPKIDENGNVIYITDENGNKIPRYLTVDNTEILAHVVLAFQEQQALIVSQKEHIETLQTTLSALEARLAALEAK